MLNGIYSAADRAEYPVVEILARWQRRPGVTVEVLTSEAGYKAFSSAYPRLVFRAPAQTFSKQIAPLLHVRQLLWAVSTPLPNRIDLVVAASPAREDVLPALRLKMTLRAQRMAVYIPDVSSAHRASALADFFWAANEHVAEALAARGILHTKIEHAYGDYQPIDPEPVPDAPARFEAIAVGARSLRNGTDILLKTWRIVRNRLLRAHLILSGYDESGFNTRARIDDLGLEGSVSFIDGLSDGQLLSLLERSKLLVVPKRDEEDERMVLAALSSAIPCATFDVPAFRYPFPHGRLIAPEPTPEALAGVIVDLLENEQLALRLAADVANDPRLPSWDNIADILWSHAFRK